MALDCPARFLLLFCLYATFDAKHLYHDQMGEHVHSIYEHIRVPYVVAGGCQWDKLCEKQEDVVKHEYGDFIKNLSAISPLRL